MLNKKCGTILLVFCGATSIYRDTFEQIDGTSKIIHLEIEGGPNNSKYSRYAKNELNVDNKDFIFKFENEILQST